MGKCINQMRLLGYLGNDPEVRNFQNGGSIVNFSLATNESWTDANTGELRERIEWHRITIRNKGLVAVAEKYLRKGSKVYIEGALRTREWEDAEGRKRYTTEISLEPYTSELILLGDPKGGRDEEPQAPAPAAKPATKARKREPAMAGAGEGADGDEVPF